MALYTTLTLTLDDATARELAWLARWVEAPVAQVALCLLQQRLGLVPSDDTVGALAERLRLPPPPRPRHCGEVGEAYGR